MGYTTCVYVARKGVCGLRCLDGRDQPHCNKHRGHTSLAWCRKDCGRATASKTGYCAFCGCFQVDEAHRMKKKQREMEAYIEDVISWDWKGYLAEQRNNKLLREQLSAPTITCSSDEQQQ